MNIDVIIDDKYNDSKIVIYTDKMSDEISHIIDMLKSENKSQFLWFYTKMYGLLIKS